MRSVAGQDWGTGNLEGTSWKHRRDGRARPGSFRGGYRSSCEMRWN
jgi:hypothetical protein